MYVGEALRVLIENKIRTLLTITGLIIGVGAVIAIQVLGSGMSGAVEGVLGGFADNSFFVQPNPSQGDFLKAAIHLRDLDQVRRQVPNISDAVPLSIVREMARSGHTHARSTVFSTSAHRYAKEPFQYGSNLTQSDVDTSAAVCLISHAAYEKLFPSGGDPVGESLHIGTHRYMIRGVLQPPRAGILNPNQGGDVSLPYTTFDRDFLHGEPMLLAVFYVADVSQIADTETATVKALRAIHRNAADIQYITFDRKQIAGFITGFFDTLTLIVGLIGAVSLVVAGIGIMNIMLVSVTERTREIGVRKAIGARRGQILAQFFIEALVLCGIGCGIGLALGLAIGFAVNELALVKLSGTVSAIPWLQATLVAVTFATVVTLAFGTYPALRAARLDPIEALRYE